LDAVWDEHYDSGRVIEDDYIVDVDSFLLYSSSIRFVYGVRQLLSHFKAEFPEEFKKIDNLGDLPKTHFQKGACIRLSWCPREEPSKAHVKSVKYGRNRGITNWRRLLSFSVGQSIIELEE
jgi:hypothetical protein